MIECRTTRYKFSHGKAPRGIGYWAFEIANETHLFQGSYGQAKKLALAEAKAKGVTIIAVLP